jgi:hypothetical protein
MDYDDHRAVYSTGSYRQAKAWRQRQQELIDVGRIDEAVQMDINDVRRRFDTKYDDAIKEMLGGMKNNPVYQGPCAAPRRTHQLHKTPTSPGHASLHVRPSIQHAREQAEHEDLTGRGTVRRSV